MPGFEPRHTPEKTIMNVLYEAHRMQNSSRTSMKSSSTNEQDKKATPREPLHPISMPRQPKKLTPREHLPPIVDHPRQPKHVTFSKPRMQVKLSHTMVRESEMQTGLTSCLITRPSQELRVPGGANNPAERKVGWLARTDSECQFKAPGIDFLTNRETDVTTFEVKMRDSVPLIKDYTTKCTFFPVYVDDRRTKDQTTQTLYRESSAQTLAYLPDILDKEEDENLEIFNLSTLLPGDKPPGLYEVELLERARKRWAFNKALKTNFMKELHDERERALKSKYRPILEAFEWEHWMEREEYIQECQMMRLEIVIRMFDKREKQMHDASKARIEQACIDIEQKRQRGLHKNEIEYQRAIRRLNIKNAGISRRWVKQSPMYALGSPCSEFYGPLIRHGVDPARRNFVGDGRKAFDMRIDELEKQVNMMNLECPFAKLKEWSKPKMYVKEYEQNFCNDKHLQKLYESLKILRTQATKQKVTPKCLHRRPKPATEVEHRLSYFYKDTDSRQYFARTVTEPDTQPRRQYIPEQEVAIQQHLALEGRRVKRPELARELLQERRSEDLENMLQMYEGTTIGWIMQFLSEEMERLQEQRKLHFFSILTQKERWRREAAEAGLRQKENNMRMLYEEMFQATNVVHTEVTDDYINTILTTDMAHIAECDAAESVVAIAKQIDKDISRWLESFKSVQTPLTYEPLRHMLAEMVFPDLGDLLAKYEKYLVVKYIVEDILFPRIWDELESYDIATVIASDLIDRLIDNDLYFFSTEESESDGGTRLRYSRREVEAILRKVIRQAVPGRRWKTETERVVHENQESLLDDVFRQVWEKINAKGYQTEPAELRHAPGKPFIQKDDIIAVVDSALDQAVKDTSSKDSQVLVKTQMLSLMRKVKKDRVTRNLEMTDVYGGDSADHVLRDKEVKTETYKRPSILSLESKNLDVFGVTSTLNILTEDDLTLFRDHENADEKMDSVLTNIGVDFDEPKQKQPKVEEPTTDVQEVQTKDEDALIGALQDMLGGYVKDQDQDQYEASEYEADDEDSVWYDDQSSYYEQFEGETELDNYDNKQVKHSTHVLEIDFVADEDKKGEEGGEEEAGGSQPSAEMRPAPREKPTADDRDTSFVSLFSEVDEAENLLLNDNRSTTFQTKLDTISKSGTYSNYNLDVQSRQPSENLP